MFKYIYINVCVCVCMQSVKFELITKLKQINYVVAGSGSGSEH